MNFKTSDMTKIAMFSVLTALGAYIQIPIPYVPITLQVLFCVLSGIILGSRKAAFSQIIYVLIGLVGLPVFAGGTGGIQTI
ncbi:MAG: biotin transporter BioY, partial [Clostridiales bacterium]|nr:biotin transporter BioY [Clostridiales bacterium]